MRYCKNYLCRVMSYLTAIDGNVDHSCPGCGKIGNRS